MSRRTKQTIHLCSFTSLDDLKRKEHGSPTAVLAVLKKSKRFSTFDISTPALGRTMDHLFKTGKIVDAGGQYPWTYLTFPMATSQTVKS